MQLKKLTKRTTSRDLSFGLVFTMSLGFAVVGTINYFYSAKRDESALRSDAVKTVENLANVLKTLVWNLDQQEINKTLESYKQSEDVLSIRVFDEDENPIIEKVNRDEPAFFIIERTLNQNNTRIGRLSMAFSDATIIRKQQEVVIYSLIVFLVVTFIAIFVTVFLLHQHLGYTFKQLMNGLRVLSSGDYTFKLPQPAQSDLQEIVNHVNNMATEIAHREFALQENQDNLETLNQAILQIFSCSDTLSLIKTALELTFKICGVEHGWFCATPSEEDFALEKESEVVPAPVMCIRGKNFELAEAEVKKFIGRSDNLHFFSYALKSRHRSVGTLTFEFLTPPLADKITLLQTLMSLVNLAMVRQSYIRETAFNTAELQVAETVQRSLLPDEVFSSQIANVSYHYQPVLRVGGDWFSCIESHDKTCVFVILADVTGHGLAQGLVTTAVAGAINVIEQSIKNFGDKIFTKPAQIISLLNTVITRIAGKSNLRMTCLAAKLDLAQKKILICNAGHTFPILLRCDQQKNISVEPLTKEQQPILGQESLKSRNHRYIDATYDFLENDVLLLYTDGLSEAMDRNGKSFHRTFLRYVNGIKTQKSADDIRQEIINLFVSHTHNSAVKDDVCLLVVSPSAKSSDVAA